MLFASEVDLRAQLFHRVVQNSAAKSGPYVGVHVSEQKGVLIHFLEAWRGFHVVGVEGHERGEVIQVDHSREQLEVGVNEVGEVVVQVDGVLDDLQGVYETKGKCGVGGDKSGDDSLGGLGGGFHGALVHSNYVLRLDAGLSRLLVAEVADALAVVQDKVVV